MGIFKGIKLGQGTVTFETFKTHAYNSHSNPNAAPPAITPIIYCRNNNNNNNNNNNYNEYGACGCIVISRLIKFVDSPISSDSNYDSEAHVQWVEKERGGGGGGEKGKWIYIYSLVISWIS